MPPSGGPKGQPFQLRLRPATLLDARFLLRLRNDPVIRKNSFSTGKIRFTDHRAWLTARLADPERRVRLYVALLSQKGDSPVAVGQVRFDCDRSEKRAEISIALSARFRGRGLGTPLLERALAGTPRFVDKVLARVRVENEASLKAFLRASFRRHGGVRARPEPHIVLLWRRPDADAAAPVAPSRTKDRSPRRVTSERAPSSAAGERRARSLRRRRGRR